MAEAELRPNKKHPFVLKAYFKTNERPSEGPLKPL